MMQVERYENANRPERVRRMLYFSVDVDDSGHFYHKNVTIKCKVFEQIFEQFVQQA